MIDVVDRIGKTHKIGELIYAYFDTSTEKYIVLDKHPEPTTPMIYGNYYAENDDYGFIKVEYAAGIDYCKDNITKGSVVTVVNKIKLDYLTGCSNGAPAIAVKMEKLKKDNDI